MEKVSANQKLAYLLLYSAAYSFFYLLPNFRPFSPPNLLPMTTLDLAIPFLPWTFLIYLSDYLLISYVIVALKDSHSFFSFSRMAFLTLSLCGIFFIFFPTTYPRPPYPANEAWPVDMLLKLMASADTPNNCFPSMHVACTAMATWAMRNQGRRTYTLLWLWGCAIFISTLTTKQHYVIDIVGGLAVTFAVATIHWAVFEKRFFRGVLATRR